MTATSLLPLILLGLLLWIWQNTRKIHERAARAAREICTRQGLQLLDGTVALQRFSWRRNASGALALRRTFLFAYSEDGVERHTGFVIMLGGKVEQVGL